MDDPVLFHEELKVCRGGTGSIVTSQNEWSFLIPQIHQNKLL